MVTADMDDVRSVRAAVAGAYGVFGVTNFWEHFSGDKELQQVRILVLPCLLSAKNRPARMGLLNSQHESKPILGTYMS